MQLSYPSFLPVSEQRQKIVQAIQENRVLIIIGDTGSGKTTQLPKMCLEAGQGENKRIGCTQPRRIAATSVAERVAEELHAPQEVGYKIRFSDHTSEKTRIKFMTDGVLLAETRQDPLLAQYDTIIVDEAHERSLNIDFLLGYLKNLLSRRDDLKLIISSATIDAEKFSAHFAQAPIITVSGQTFPITTLYQEELADEEEAYVERAIRAVEELMFQPFGGDILVFMPTERDIMDTLDGLRSDSTSNTLLLPLFGRLPAAEQRKIFHPSKKRKIIVSTNVAETSVTVPGIRFVVDTGLARISRYNPRTGTTNLQVSRISQASCDQRRGRCGRTGPGTCIRLYSEEDYLSREEFTPPEIQRSNLAEVILQMTSLQLGDPSRFPFIDPPPANAIREGFRTLKELGALNAASHLTAHGRLMAQLPLDPKISRIIIAAKELQALKEITILAAALSIQDPRVRPPEKEFKADEAHRQFVDKSSDFMTLLNIWNGFHDQQAPATRSRLSKFCKTHYLSWQRMREWMDIHEQIRQLLRRQKGFIQNSEPAGYDALHQALSSGFLRNICRKKEKNVYQASGEKEVVLFPGSGLYNKGPDWAIAAEFVETTQLFARTLAGIKVEWLEQLAGELCKRSWSEPHWHKKSGKVLALERVTLFGLPIVAGRRVEYGRINAHTRQEAREIFIRSALINRQLGGKYSFHINNIALIDHYNEMEDRFRRRDIIVDEETLFQFYDTRLGQVYDRFTLNRFLKRKKDEDFLCMRQEDICLTVPDAEEQYRFPSRLRLGEMDIALQYLFEPGQDADGVTARIPMDLVPHLNSLPFEWLVPGLLPEKLLLLLKRLPKQLRRRLVPLPDAVDRIMDALSLYQGSFYQELERIILRSYQVTVQRTDWQADALPAHLRMRFVLVDEQGHKVFNTRNFEELLLHKESKSIQATTQVKKTLPARRAITVTELDGISKRLPLTDSAGRMTGLYFPALSVDEKSDTIWLDYLDDENLSKQKNRLGLQALYAQDFRQEMTALRKTIKEAITAHSASWFSLGAGLRTTELQATLQAFLLDLAFATRSGELPSEQQFAEQLALVRQQGLLRMLKPTILLLLDILQERRKVRSKIDQWAERAKANRHYLHTKHEEMLKALEHILPEHFLQTLKIEQLQHKIRYLRALALRLERAEHAPLKDEKKAERLKPILNRLQELKQFRNTSLGCQDCQQEYLDLIEEFKVSLFAPELGTAQPVSEKRLQQKWQEVENLCRLVE